MRGGILDVMLKTILSGILGFVAGLLRNWFRDKKLKQLERDNEARGAMKEAEAARDEAQAGIDAAGADSVPSAEEANIDDALDYLDRPTSGSDA